MEQKDLIQKWLNNELSPSEQQKWEALEDAAYMEQLLKDASAFKASVQSQVASFDSLKERLPQPAAQKPKERYWLRIAAVLVVGLALWFGLSDRSGVVLDAPAGEQMVHQLPDRSKVQLNAGSRLTYNQKNWQDDRSLQLQGEAYFDVEKGATFQVQTTLGTVSVLGTQFNVRQRNGLFQVRCFEGRVAVEIRGETTELLPGKGLRLMGEEVSLFDHQDAAPSWLAQNSQFKALPYRYVVAELERQYKISITYPQDLQDELFTGGFSHRSLDAALRAIAAPMELEIASSTKASVTFKKRAP